MGGSPFFYIDCHFYDSLCHGFMSMDSLFSDCGFSRFFWAKFCLSSVKHKLQNILIVFFFEKNPPFQSDTSWWPRGVDTAGLRLGRRVDDESSAGASISDEIFPFEGSQLLNIRNLRSCEKHVNQKYEPTSHIMRKHGCSAKFKNCYNYNIVQYPLSCNNWRNVFPALRLKWSTGPSGPSHAPMSASCPTGDGNDTVFPIVAHTMVSAKSPLHLFPQSLSTINIFICLVVFFYWEVYGCIWTYYFGLVICQ